MLDDDGENSAESGKRTSRRTRGERTKRREKYLLMNQPKKCEPNTILSNNAAPSSLSSSGDNNNFFKFHKESLKTSNAKQPVRKQVDHLYKILVIGDCGSGKTSIIKRYVHKFFTQHYRSTMGVDFALKVLNWDENTLIRLQLWDIAGQERYNNMTRVYYKDAVGAFIVFDVTRVHTFESVATWKADLDSKVLLPNDSPVPCVLLANKCDLQKEGLVNNPGKMEEYCKEKGFIAWFETSAKDNINVDEAAKALIEKILENDTLNNIESNKDDSKFSLEKDSNLQKNGGKKCSC